MPFTYSFRKSAIEKTQYLELTENDIICRQENRKDIRIPYKNVQSIRLLFLANNRYRPNSYSCKIDIGNSSFDIHSYKYEGFTDFKEQTAQYVPFVKELVRRIKPSIRTVYCLQGKLRQHITVTLQ